MPSRKQHLSITQRNLILDLVNDGNSYRRVQEKTGIPFTTVSSIMKKYSLIGTTADIPGRGHKRKTTPAIDRNFIISVKKNRFESANNIAQRIEKDHNLKITPQTVRNRIRENGFHSRVVRKNRTFPRITYKNG